MKPLKITALAVALVLIAVALFVFTKTHRATKAPINNDGAAMRFTDYRKFDEASIVEFKLLTPAGTAVFHTTEPRELRRLQENICRPMITISEENVRGQMIKLKYEIIFNDGLAVLNEAELNLFSDRAYLRIYFNDDESWIDSTITYRHDVLDRYVRIEEPMYKSVMGGLASQSMDVHSTKYWRDAESEAKIRLNSNTGNP